MSCQDYPLQFEERCKAQRMELLEEENKELREREKNLKRLNQQFSRLLETIQNELESTRNKLRESEKQHSQVIEKYQQENRTLKRVLEEEQAKKNSRTETQHLKAEMEKMYQFTQVSQLQEEIRQLKLQMSHKAQNHDDLRQREQTIRIKEKECVMMVSTLQRRLKQETQFHEEAARKYEVQIRKLEGRIDELQDKRIEKENSIADLYTQFKELQIENTCLLKKIAVLQSTIQEEKEKAKGRYGNQLEALKKQNDSLKQLVKVKEFEHRVASQQSKKIILNEKAKRSILQDAANKIKSTYQQKNSIIVKQLLNKEEKISSLQKQLSRSRSKNHSINRPSSPNSLRMTYDEDKLSMGQYSISSSVKGSINKELFRSRQNRQIEFTIEKNPFHKCK